VRRGCPGFGVQEKYLYISKSFSIMYSMPLQALSAPSETDLSCGVPIHTGRGVHHEQSQRRAGSFRGERLTHACLVVRRGILCNLWQD